MKAKLKQRNSKITLILFAVLFAGIGTYFIISSFAANGSGPTSANLWINNAVSGTCSRSPSKITYAQASATPSKTCSSFQAAVSATVNGALDANGDADTIIVKSGNTTAYSASLSNISRSPTVTIYEDSGGTSIVSGGSFVGVNGVTIDGTTGLNQQGFVEAGSGGGYNFSGNGQAAVTNFALKGVRTKGELYMLNCSNITVDHVEIYDKHDGEDSIQMSGWYLGPGSYSNYCSNVTFNHMYIHDITCSGTEGDHLDFIQILAGNDIAVKNSRMIGMTCHTISGAASGSQGWFLSGGFQTDGTVFRNMTLENTVISGIDPLDSGGGAIAVYTANGVRMANNTLDGNLKTEDSPHPPSNVTFINNISNGSCSSANTFLAHKGTGTYANNVFVGSACNSNLGDTATSNFNSMFIDPANRDFHLKTGAFAINKGTNNGCPVTDADDLVRPSPGGACDAGAYEYGSGTASVPADHVVPYDSASPWNQPIPSNATKTADSDKYVGYLGTIGKKLTSNPDDCTVNVYLVDNNTPKYDVPIVDYNFNSYDVPNVLDDMGGVSASDKTAHNVPIPTGAVADGCDGQITLWNPITGDEWGFWLFKKTTSGTYKASNGFHTKTTAGFNGRFGDGKAGRGAGTTYFAGLVRKWEIEQGRIEHALAFAYTSPCCGDQSTLPEKLVYPAGKTDGAGNDTDSGPEGTRYQLDPAISDTTIRGWGCTNACFTIAKALQKYGMYAIDNSGSSKIYLEEETTAQWSVNPTNNADIQQVASLRADLPSTIPWANFRVVDIPCNNTRLTTCPTTTTPPPTCTKQPDINCDNSVNVTDLSILLSNYGKTTAQLASSTPSYPRADINNSGKVDIGDLSALLTGYGK